MVVEVPWFLIGPLHKPQRPAARPLCAPLRFAVKTLVVVRAVAVRKAANQLTYRNLRRLEDKASKDFREARANGRVLSSQVVKEFT